MLIDDSGYDIIVKNVKKYFKQVKAVDDVSLSIKRGEFAALLGPNGAGKTTLVEMIEGIQHPDSGEITIKCKKWGRNNKELQRILGISFQETKFIDKLKVIETFELFASFYRLNHERIEEILDIINLKDKRNSYVVHLSGGQRQKMAVGLAILNKPQILLLDEPTTGLDPAARREIWDILVNLRNERNTSLILTTHYMEEAEYLCDYIIIMDNGKVIAEGTLDKLLSKTKNSEVAELIYEKNTITQSTIQQISNSTNQQLNIVWDIENCKATLNYVDGKITDHLPELLEFIKSNEIRMKALSFRKLTLEDLFIEMTGRKLSE
jgi:ABC-2 type transport system ATP-binding protein